MSYKNLATQKILNNVDSYGPDQNFGDGFPYLKFAWEVSFSQAEEAGAGANSNANTPAPNNAQNQVQNYLSGAVGDFGLTPSSSNGTPSTTTPATGEQGLNSSPTVIAKTCELPRWSTDTQIVNVYNHKTLVQTKLTYEPITITFYDQVGGGVEKLIWTHVKGQFDSTDGSKAAKKSPLTIVITMKNLSRQGPDKVYTLKNAYITDAQHDTLDYSSSDVILWTITVRYEDLETNEFNAPTPADATGVPKKPKITKKIEKTPPVVAPPDAVKAEEAPPYADPMGTTDPAIIMWAAKPEGSFQWPWTKKSTQVNGTASVSPSTGSTAPARNNKQPTQALSSQQTGVLDKIKASESFKASSPAWKDAFVKSYAMDPPTSHEPYEVQRAIKAAQIKANSTTTRYTSFASPADSGVQNSNKINRSTEPSPPVVRDGNNIINPKINDAKGQSLTNTQEERQRMIESAQSVNDKLAAERAFKTGKLTPAQKKEFFQTGKVSSIKGANADGTGGVVVIGGGNY
jgi:hypothetical protein